jgi:hypothetical protein
MWKKMAYHNQSGPKLYWSNLKTITSFFEIIINTYNEGVCLYITDKEKVINRIYSGSSDDGLIKIVTTNKKGGAADQVLAAGDIVSFSLTPVSTAQIRALSPVRCGRMMKAR